MEYIIFEPNIKIVENKLNGIIKRIIDLIDNENFLKYKINQNINIFQNKKTKEKYINEEDFIYLLNFYLNQNLILNRKNKRIINDFFIKKNFKIDIFKKKVYFNSNPRSRSLKYQKKSSVKLKQSNYNIKDSFIEKNYNENLDINKNKENIVITSPRYKEVISNIKEGLNDLEEDDLTIKTNEKEELLDELSPLFSNPFENKNLSIVLGIFFGIIIALIALYGIRM